MLPYYPNGSDSTAGHQYTITSWWQHMVAEYAGISLLQVRELNYIQYLIWRRDAFIYRLSRTEEGSEYLDNAYRMEQTKPDRARLREKLRKEERENGC